MLYKTSFFSEGKFIQFESEYVYEDDLGYEVLHTKVFRSDEQMTYSELEETVGEDEAWRLSELNRSSVKEQRKNLGLH
jgi:hypothetical protein